MSDKKNGMRAKETREAKRKRIAGEIWRSLGRILRKAAKHEEIMEEDFVLKCAGALVEDHFKRVRTKCMEQEIDNRVKQFMLNDPKMKSYVVTFTNIPGWESLQGILGYVATVHPLPTEPSRNPKVVPMKTWVRNAKSSAAGPISTECRP